MLCKRILTFAITLAAVCALSVSASAAPLTDLSADDWYYAEVSEMVDGGYINGYEDGTFRGRNSISLAEFVTIAARLVNVECGAADGFWAGRQMASAQKLGWLNGADLAAIAPNAPISRELAAKVLVKALNVPRAVHAIGDYPITDRASIGEPYVVYVAAAYEAGLFVGDKQGNFSPRDAVIRGAAATLLYRALHLEDPLSRYTKQEIIDYFVEVTIYSGNDAVGEDNIRQPIRKWSIPIYYTISGEYTAAGIELLDAVMERMNSVAGFPGIFPASSSKPANMTIRFLNDYDMDRATGEYLPNALDGYYYIWWNDYTLLKSDISYRASIKQEDLNSTLCEELIQATGLGNDSYTYSDSIFYEPFMPTQWPSAIDWALFDLLYDPAIRHGMDEAQVRAVLDTLIPD